MTHLRHGPLWIPQCTLGVVIPQDPLDRIAGLISPRSSLIVSDEELSAETGKDTEFVVVLRGEPQGGIKSRRLG